MPRLLVLDEPLQDFLELAMGTWEQDTSMERDEKTEGHRMDLFHVRRQLEGKYTPQELLDIIEGALALAE